MENQSQSKKTLKKFKKGIDKPQKMWHNISVLRERDKKFQKVADYQSVGERGII